MERAEAVALLTRSPERTGIFTDFDGTLSEIVSRPEDARPYEGVSEVLSRLSRHFAVVAIVSGRAAGQLVEWLGPEVEIWGVHGAERAQGGEVRVSDAVAAYVEDMQSVRREAEEALASLALEGVAIEEKSVTVGFHYRRASDQEAARAAVEELAAALARRHGLTIGRGRMTLELRPPVELSKRALVLDRARAASLDTAAFLGDDVVDLPAFDALDELEAEGCRGIRVAVDSEEAPPEVLQSADLVVDGPAGALALLEELA